MAYLPFGMSPAAPVGPTVPVINDRNPARTLTNIVAHVSSPVLTSIGANLVFTTAPDRGRFFPTAVWFHPSAATGASATPVVRLGYTNSGAVYSDWISSFSFLSSLAANQFFELSLKADAGGAAPTGRYSAPPSTGVYLYVATASPTPVPGELIVAGFYS